MAKLPNLVFLNIVLTVREAACSCYKVISVRMPEHDLLIWYFIDELSNEEYTLWFLRLVNGYRCDVQGSVRIQDNGIHENKVGVELIKEAASESDLNSIYLTQLLHDVDHSVVLTLTVVRITSCFLFLPSAAGGWRWGCTICRRLRLSVQFSRSHTCNSSLATWSNPCLPALPLYCLCTFGWFRWLPLLLVHWSYLQSTTMSFALRESSFLCFICQSFILQ